MAGLVTASRVYPTCGTYDAQLGQARVAVPPTSLMLHAFQDVDSRDKRGHDGALKSHNQASLVVSVSFNSIQIFTTSPALRNSPRAEPTPAGVPVRIRSPGWSVMAFDSCSICSAKLKIMPLLLESCLRTSFTHSLRPRFCGSPMSLAGTIHGPSGQEPSNVLCLVQSDLNGEVSLMPARRPRSRAERSLAAVYPAT